MNPFLPLPISSLLLLVTGENLQHATANVEDEAHLDVSAGVVGAFFDVGVFNQTTSSHHNTAVASLYRQFVSFCNTDLWQGMPKVHYV